jgi:LuxR family transcriptional regulator, maltose regulon positive regulatory protein
VPPKISRTPEQCSASSDRLRVLPERPHTTSATENTARTRRPAATSTAAAARVRATRLSKTPALEVVESKIHVPEPRPGTVSRTALVNRLRTIGSSPIITLSAPAGYGKTTLLAHWAARDARPFAWVCIDERDNDPVVFLREVGAALDAVEPLSPRIVRALNAPGGSIWASALPRLGAALSARAPLVVVLDDSHLLRTKDCLQAVSVLGDHLPDGSMLVLSGRATPRLPIAALRASGRLIELGVEELALDRREAQLLLQATGVDLSLAETKALIARCEGWPAGLYLAGLALRDEEDDATRDEQIAAFRGDDRYVTDYFRGEYLSGLRPGAHRFLRRTSVLERMSGPLCDAVLADTGSARELEKIERSNLFLVPLDHRREWYRYHHLFRDLLQRELAETEPELVPTLHRRAADWYEAHGDPESALEHAAAEGDDDRTARIVTAIALPVYFSGRVATVERWLERFDAGRRERYPGVALMGAWVHGLRGRREEAQEWLAAAERGSFEGELPDGSRSLEAWTAALRAALCRDGVDQMLADAERALADLPPRSLARPAALVVQGAAYLLLGEAERGDAILSSAADEAERVGATDTCVVAISERSLIASARGDAAAADALAAEASELVDSANLDGYVTSAIALATSARAQLRHGRWDAARARLAKVQLLRPLLRESAFPWFGIQTRLELARAYLALRDSGGARSLLAEVSDILRLRPHVGVLSEQVEALREEVEGMPESADGAGAGLTGAELRLLPLLTTHLSFREIGERLYVSRNTIKTQAISVYRKLGVSSRSEAIRRADELGLVDVSGDAA